MSFIQELLRASLGMVWRSSGVFKGRSMVVLSSFRDDLGLSLPDQYDEAHHPAECFAAYMGLQRAQHAGKGRIHCKVVAAFPEQLVGYAHKIPELQLSDAILKTSSEQRVKTGVWPAP